MNTLRGGVKWLLFNVKPNTTTIKKLVIYQFEKVNLGICHVDHTKAKAILT